MASVKLEKKLKALAQLALQIGSFHPEKIVGIAPSDEELASLYENQLDDTRRAQIFSHIANSEHVHERWVRCVETLSYMDELENKSTSTASNKNKLGLSGFVSNLFNTKILLGGGFSTAVIIVIVISILPQQSPFDVQLSLNGAYEQWGGLLESEWNALPDAQKPEPQYSNDRSFFTEPKEKSKVQQVLETGYKKGMIQIGEKPFNDFGITVTTLSDIPNSEVSTLMTTQQYDILIQTGHLAAFATIQCSLDSSSKRLEVFSTALTALRPQLADLQFNDAVDLISATENKNEPTVCLTAQYIVKLITNLTKED